MHYVKTKLQKIFCDEADIWSTGSSYPERLLLSWFASNPLRMIKGGSSQFRSSIVSLGIPRLPSTKMSENVNADRNLYDQCFLRSRIMFSGFEFFGLTHLLLKTNCLRISYVNYFFKLCRFNSNYLIIGDTKITN